MDAHGNRPLGRLHVPAHGVIAPIASGRRGRRFKSSHHDRPNGLGQRLIESPPTRPFLVSRVADDVPCVPCVPHALVNGHRRTSAGIIDETTPGATGGPTANRAHPRAPPRAAGLGQPGREHREVLNLVVDSNTLEL